MFGLSKYPPDYIHGVLYNFGKGCLNDSKFYNVTPANGALLSADVNKTIFM